MKKDQRNALLIGGLGLAGYFLLTRQQPAAGAPGFTPGPPAVANNGGVYPSITQTAYAAMFPAAGMLTVGRTVQLVDGGPQYVIVAG